MLSKPSRHTDGPGGLLGFASCGQRRLRTVFEAALAAVGAPDSAPVIRTTVDHLRCSPAEVKAPSIRTTVSESRSRASRVSVAALRKAVAKPDALSAAEVEARREEERKRWVDAARSMAPALLLQAPLQLLSPWASLSSVTMAGVPPPPPLPFQRGIPMALPPGLQEEEQFAALIFPGFDSGAFIWQITCWQVAEFVFSMWLGHNRANPTPCVLYRLGASWGPAVARGQLWRLVTPVMLHANLTHLLFNVFFQLRMGFGMEKQFGRDKMMMLYFACGLFGNLMSVSLDPFKLAVGASTAGFGLIGVWLAEICLSWEVLGPARERTVLWIVFMLISVTTMSTMTPNMDLWGHLGGALGGFLLSIVISDMREQDRPKWYPQARAAAALAIVLFLSGGLGKTLLLSPRDPIPDCPLFQSLTAAVAAAAGAQ